MPVSAPVLELEDVPMLRPHMLFPGLLAVAFGAVAFGAVAGEPTPEIQRKPGAPQAIGVAHTLRTIPEACARLEGRFTGDAAAPYRFTAVRSSARCQPRARLVDAAAAKPSAASGWVLNDVVRVPNAGCPSQRAVVLVRESTSRATYTFDGRAFTAEGELRRSLGGRGQ